MKKIDKEKSVVYSQWSDPVSLLGIDMVMGISTLYQGILKY